MVFTMGGNGSQSVRELPREDPHSPALSKRTKEFLLRGCRMPRKKRSSRLRKVVAARLKPSAWIELRAEARRSGLAIGELLERMIAMEVKRRQRRRKGGSNGEA